MGKNLMILPSQLLIYCPAAQSFQSSWPPGPTEENKITGPDSVSGYRRNHPQPPGQAIKGEKRPLLVPVD
jgi:hypothetical protein